MPTHESSSREKGSSKSKHRHHKSHRKRKHSSSPDSSVRHSRKRSPTNTEETSRQKVRSRSRSPAKAIHEDREGGGADTSLSISETNKLRAKLGLAPLEVGDSNNADNENGKKDHVHAPAVNYGSIKRTEQIKEKLQTQKDKRAVMDKLGKVKGLGEADDEAFDSAADWVQRSRKILTEKEMAEKRAKLMDEMDEDFGIGNLIKKDQQISQKKSQRYGSKDLGGMIVEHDVTQFQEGKTVILTLKDRGILEEGDDDDIQEVLVNINMIDDEKVKKSIEGKRQAALGWKKAHLMEEEDPVEAAFHVTGVLDKYNVEIEGDKKKSFTLMQQGRYETDHEKALEQLRAEMRAGAQSLDVNEPRIASDFFTEDEMQARFRKRKRKTNQATRRKRVTADELLSMNIDPASTHLDNAVDAAENPNKEEEKSIQINLKPRMKDLPEPRALNPVESDDEIPQVEVEPDEAFDDLQRALHQVRKLQSRPARDNQADLMHLLQANVKVEPAAAEVKSNAVVLNATREYCRNIGITMKDYSGDNLLSTMPTSSHKGSNAVNAPNMIKDEPTVKEEVIEEEEEEEQEEEAMEAASGSNDTSGWHELGSSDTPNTLAPIDVEVKTKRSKANKSPELRGVLDDEPSLNQGLASALQLANKKGYIDKKKAEQPIIGATMSLIVAKNFIREDIRYDDIDAKFAKRERFSHGPLMDFKDKDGYKPDFKLEYVDELGRHLNEKEAFRQLSHRFHGKGSGKRKTERRIQKIEEEMAMAHMSSSDTPLGSAEKLHKKLETEGLPYVVLSGKNANLKKLSK